MIEEALVGKILKRYDRLKTVRSQVEPFFRNVRDYIRPTVQGADVSEITVGERHTDKRFDSTASESARIMSSSMQNALTPQASMWFGQEIPAGHELAHLNQDEEVAEYHQRVGDIVFNALNSSNFYTVIGEAFYDFVTFGTINLLVEELPLKNESFAGFNFRGIPVGRFVFAEDNKGKPDTVIWEYKMTARQIVMEFGANKAGQKVRDKLEQDPDAEFKMLKCLKPRESFDKTKKDFLNFPFVSYDVILDSKIVVGEEGFHELPFIVARFEKVAGEVWGRSPADIAMPDIISLNRLREMELKALSKAVDPPILAPDEGILGQFKLNPNSINFVREPERFKFMKYEGRIDFTSLKAGDLKQSIRNIYLADQLILPEKLNMTAEEIITIRRQQQRLLGPNVARFESEALGPLIFRCTRIIERAGGLPEKPQSLQDVEASIKYKGSISKAQRLEELQSTQSWIQNISSLASLDPSVIDVVDLDAVTDLAGDNLGVPYSVRRTIEEVAEIREQRQQKQDEQEQLATQTQQSEIAKNTAPALQVLSEQGGIPGAIAGGQ